MARLNKSESIVIPSVRLKRQLEIDLPAANPYPVPYTDGVSIAYPDPDVPAYLVDPFLCLMQLQK